jgi:hypothetical protein
MPALVEQRTNHLRVAVGNRSEARERERERERERKLGNALGDDAEVVGDSVVVVEAALAAALGLARRGVHVRAARKALVRAHVWRERVRWTVHALRAVSERSRQLSATSYVELCART